MRWQPGRIASVRSTLRRTYFRYRDAIANPNTVLAFDSRLARAESHNGGSQKPEKHSLQRQISDLGAEGGSGPLQVKNTSCVLVCARERACACVQYARVWV